MDSFISWTNSVASWFVGLAVGWQLLLALLILIPLAYVLAKYVVLPPIDAVQRAYRRRVDDPIEEEPFVSDTSTASQKNMEP
ncbi:MAG: hypothetical protein WAN89_03830 [Lawsonella sp.]|nr:hypothetical protein [Mycobacteriales bacterium]